MNKKIIVFLLIVLTIFSLSACREQIGLPEVPDISGPNDGNQGGEENPPIKDGETEFIVSLSLNKKVYLPKEGEQITVTWDDGFTQHSQVIGTDGYARANLDGEFNVYLDSTPENYTYNPNINVVDNENPVIEIELLRISKNEGGNGSALFREYKMSDTGNYRANITSKNKKVFYEYMPKKAGYLYGEYSL